MNGSEKTKDRETHVAALQLSVCRRSRVAASGMMPHSNTSDATILGLLCKRRQQRMPCMNTDDQQPHITDCAEAFMASSSSSNYQIKP
jgi:hypothetical protein